MGGEAPTLSPPARIRPGPGRAASSSSNSVARYDAPLTGTLMLLSPTTVVGSSCPWKSLMPTIEMGLIERPPLQDLGQHAALALLGLGDVEDVGEGRGEVDGPGGDGPAVDAGAVGEERRPHVDVVGQVLDVRHVAVLAEEVRGGDQRARRRRVELVGRERERDDVARPRRVGHVGRAAGPVRDVAGLGLRKHAVDDLPAFGLAVVRPVVGVGQALVGRDDLGDGRVDVGRFDLRERRRRRDVDGIATLDVEIDLHGAAGPAGLGRADGLADRRPAVRGLRLGQQAEVNERLAGVDGQELGANP